MRAERVALGLAVLLWLTPGGSPAHQGHRAPESESASASESEPEPAERLYRAPEPGSYELPPIGRVRDWTLLDHRGAEASLPALDAGQVALVSFIYASCPDAGGCPLALATLQKLDRRVHAEPALRGRVRLASVSFDPEHDDPETLEGLRRALAPKGDWRFLTSASERALAPVLADYGQDAVRLLDDDGRPAARIRHVLKVFLVDDRHRVRNIYSADFLNPELLLADLETVLGEGQGRFE